MLIIGLLLILGGHHKSNLPRPPSFVGYTSMRCESVRDFNPGETPRWKTHVIIDFGPHRGWEQLLSMRDDLKPALKDCSEWLDYISKVAKKELKH